MSRSYKKTPRAGDRKNKYFKKYFNRRLRRSPDSFRYKSYRKFSESWDVCDYEEVGTSFNEYYRQRVGSWHKWGKKCGEPYPDKDEEYLNYFRWFKRK
jgi:hypothetical protein